ncbi:MAG: EthD family reductase [Acidobacteria bacterium]|nr:MAG: EthD family reductase [Acidobacteriota bacterium]
MVRVSVMYPNHEGTKFDMTYYINRHIPMVRQLLGSALRGVSVEQGISGEGPGSPASYVAMGHLLFDSVEAFQTSFGPHAQAIMEDIPNYTNSEPIVQISEVKL